jgi:Mg2+ and Co2+ transporter CorA
MKEILGENMVFHTKAQITNKSKNKSSKLYDNVLVIKDDNFDNFLKDIDGAEEEIEEIKFKLKKKQEKELESITVIK